MTTGSVPPPFQLTIDTTSGALPLVNLVGELDLASAPKLVEALESIDGGVGLDMSGVSFMDSSGLRALMSGRERAEEAGVPFVVLAISEQVARLLDLAGVADVLQVVGPVDG